MKFGYLIALMILITAAIAGCLGEEDEDDDGDDITIMINGKEYTIHDIFEDFQTKSVTGSNEQDYEGVSLQELLEDAGVADLDKHQYRISASDGYSKNVTHLDIQEGILVKEETMTVFPDLPGKYRIRDVVSIEPIEGQTITINGKFYTWMQPFDIFTSVLWSNETVEVEGVQLSDLLNGTVIEDPQDHNYTISADDGYQKEFTWDDMLNGILVNDNDRSVFFPHLDKKFHIKNVVEIKVV